MDSNPFLSYKNTTLTFKEFDDEVIRVINHFRDFKDIDDFVLLKEENPITFYTLLFALWKKDKKVIFPNRDSFNGDIPKFAKYIIENGEIKLNTHYKHIELIPNGNTILFSSGSTGKPKGILHNRDNFFENAKSVLDSLKITKITSVTLLKPYLVSALNHFLVHKMSKSHLIFLDMDFISNIKELSIKYKELSYIGSPMHIVSMLPFIQNLNPRLFFSSGDIFYPSVIEELLVKYPKISFFNVYGMAELGGRMFINKIVSQNLDQIKSIGQNIDGTTIEIKNDEVLVKSDFLFDGYIIDNIFHQRVTQDFQTGDKIIKVNNHYEFFGRSNDEIKVAGNKVSLKYIEQKISSVLPESYTPVVVSQQHELLGNIVILVIYSQNLKNLLNRNELIKSLRSTLETYELPHKFFSTNSLPYTQTMKIDRKEIIKQLNNMEQLK